MDNLLEIRDLKVDFILKNRIIPAVDAASLDIRKNEVVLLAGESGSGKTVSALSIVRILPPNARITSKSIRFEGLELSTMPDDLLNKIRGKDIAYIFQEPASFLNPVYTIGSQITESIIIHQGKPKEEAQTCALELLDSVNIHDPKRVFYSYPHQLSGGMNQRAFVAMSLSSRPKLLIADEPTTSLDVTIEAQILELLLRLKKEFSFSLLFITHNLSIAKKIADRIYIMHRGKIVEEGSKEDIFQGPKHFHTKELIQAYEKIGKL